MWSLLAVVHIALLLLPRSSMVVSSRVDNVKFELLNVNKPLPLDQSNLIALLTEAWFSNYYFEKNFSNVKKIALSYQDQEITDDGKSSILTFHVDMTYESSPFLSTTKDGVVVDVYDDIDMLRLPFRDMEWVFKYSRTLRSTGGVLTQFVGPVLLLSAAGQEIQSIPTSQQDNQGLKTNGDFDMLSLFLVLGTGAAALLFCGFATILLFWALSNRISKRTSRPL